MVLAVATLYNHSAVSCIAIVIVALAITHLSPLPSLSSSLLTRPCCRIIIIIILYLMKYEYTISAHAHVLLCRLLLQFYALLAYHCMLSAAVAYAMYYWATITIFESVASVCCFLGAAIFSSLSEAPLFCSCIIMHTSGIVTAYMFYRAVQSQSQWHKQSSNARFKALMNEITLSRSL